MIITTRRTSITAILAALATVGALLVACGVSTGIPDGMTDACELGGRGVLFANEVNPAQAVDFVGIRKESTEPRARVERDSGAPAPAPVGGTQEAAWTAAFTSDVRGTPCSGAKDKVACQAKISALRILGTSCQGLDVVPKAAPSEAREPTPGYCTASYLVYTRGDEVGVVTNSTEARAFFGDIDTPKEAIYTAQMGGEGFSCGLPGIPAYVAVADGFELQANGGNCASRIVRVSRQGVVTFVRGVDLC